MNWLTFILYSFISVYWSPTTCWGSEINHGEKSARQTQAFPLGAYIFSCPLGILAQMFHLYIKNSCKIKVIITTLKYFNTSVKGLPFLHFLRPQTSNHQLFSFAFHNESIHFALQIHCNFLFSILTLPF